MAYLSGCCSLLSTYTLERWQLKFFCIPVWTRKTLVTWTYLNQSGCYWEMIRNLKRTTDVKLVLLYPLLSTTNMTFRTPILRHSELQFREGQWSSLASATSRSTALLPARPEPGTAPLHHSTSRTIYIAPHTGQWHIKGDGGWCAAATPQRNFSKVCITHFF